jgi:hypothetical protein
MHIILIQLLNNKTSRKGKSGNNYQILGKQHALDASQSDGKRRSMRRNTPRRRFAPMNPDLNSSRPVVYTGRPYSDFHGMYRHEVQHHAWHNFSSQRSNSHQAAESDQAATRCENEIMPPRGGRARSDCQEARPRPGRREAAEPDNQSAKLRSSWMIWGEGGGAGSGGAPSQ